MTTVRKNQRSSPPHRGRQPQYSPAHAKPRRSPFSFLGSLLIGSLLLGTTATASALVGLAISFRNLPDVYQLRNYVPVATTHIIDINGEPIVSLHGEANREVIPIGEVAPDLKQAVLAIEDSHFYTHRGINPIGLGRAILGSVEGGLGASGGGSTLTMQLVKNLFLTPERAISRKMAEAVLAVRLEQVFTKDQIFEMYLNQVYWGHNLYGIQTAAESYFSKPAANLNLAESALLAGMLQAPERLSPFRDFKGAKQRQKVVLNRMAELGWITPQQAKDAYNQKLVLGRITSFQVSAPPITDAIEAELRQRYGEEALTRGGLRIQTTIDMNLQRLAERTVNAGVQRLAAAGRNATQMALVSVDPRTGFIKALVGGVYAKRGQFNRATQAHRQSGSTFKPFVYYTALASGRYSPYTILSDSPISYPGYPVAYSPQNYDNTFAGLLPLNRCLQLSRNVPTVKLANDLGIKAVIQNAHAAGIKTELFPNLSTALGSGSVTPLEMASAYATIANGGFQVQPTLILQVVDRNGQILNETLPRMPQVLDPWAAATTTQIMQGVITSGTGTRAQLDDGRPVAGKTGTTSDFRDAWFIGFVPQMATAIWIGNDNNTPMAFGTAGGAFVAPTWKVYMTEALKGVPAQSFPNPSKFPPPQAR